MSVPEGLGTSRRACVELYKNVINVTKSIDLGDFLLYCIEILRVFSTIIILGVPSRL